MIIGNFVSELSEDAIVSSLNSTSLIVFDKNELRIYVGFVKYGNSIEYVNEVCLQLSTEIPKRVKFTEIVVSKNGAHAILLASKSAYVVRINQEMLMTKTDQFSTDLSCECYSLHESFLMKSSTLTIIQARILPHKVHSMTIVAILFSDNCVRFYDMNKKKDGLLLALDFRPFVHDFSENVTLSNNTFGLHKSIVSFDFRPTTDSTFFSVLAVDSDCDFYSSTIFYSCFTEAEFIRINKIESLDSLPCNPLSLQFIDTPGQEIASIFVLLSAGCTVTHLVAVPNELSSFETSRMCSQLKKTKILETSISESSDDSDCALPVAMGEPETEKFEKYKYSFVLEKELAEKKLNPSLLIYDQLQIPSHTGDPKLLSSQIRYYNRNRYEIATSTSLYSVNIASWVDDLISNSPSSSARNNGTVVVELLNIVDREVSNKKGKTLTATSLVLRSDQNTDFESQQFTPPENMEILHLVIVEKKEIVAVSTFASTSSSQFSEKFLKKSGSSQISANMHNRSTIAMLIGSLNTLPACVISEKLSKKEAIASTMKYLKSVEETILNDRESAMDGIELCMNMQIGATSLGEEQQVTDERLIKETKNVEKLKKKMHNLKGRIETLRKTINVLISRVEDNAPLSEMEFRIFDRLKHHQNMLSQLSIKIPKLALDLNEKRRTAQSIQMRKITNQPNKFANVEKNTIDIENLVQRIERLQQEVENLSS